MTSVLFHSAVFLLQLYTKMSSRLHRVVWTSHKHVVLHYRKNELVNIFSAKTDILVTAIEHFLYCFNAMQHFFFCQREFGN